MSSSVRATNSPPFSAKEPGAIRRRIRFSAMHSAADSGSLTAYRAPECSRPWWRPVVPEVSSPRSSSVTRSPRSTRSWASAAPVPPPPTTATCPLSMLGTGSACDQHGTVAQVQDLVGDAAQQQRAQVGASTGAHHDQAGVQLVGQVGDDPGDVTVADLAEGAVGLDAGGLQVGRPALGELGRVRVELVVDAGLALVAGGHRLGDVQDDDLVLTGLG